MSNDNQNNVLGHVGDARPINVAGLGSAQEVYDPQTGVGRNKAVSSLDDGSPFYDPWLSEGLRVELQAIRGVTKKGMLQMPFRFQVPPLDEFRVEMGVVASDYSTIQHGTFTDINGDELATVSFETLVTIAPASWVIAKGLWNPNKIGHRLQHLLKAESPMRLVAWHAGPVVEINMPVTFRNLSKTEKGGETDARYFSMSFTQWRDPVVRRRTKKTWPRRHKLSKGDTLASIARKFWGKPGQGRWVGMNNKHLHQWGIRTSIVKNKHYKLGDIIKVPYPPKTKLGQRRRAR